MLRKTTFIAFLVALALNVSSAWAVQLNYGKYFGTLQMDGQSEVMAVSLDAFVTQITDPTVYPALEVIVRVNLGGYLSPEYMSYDFYDPTYNFERGILSLNAPNSDLTGSLQTTTTDSQAVLEGTVVHRLTNSKGKLRVVRNLEDDGQLPEPAPSLPFVTTLRGEYRGICGKDQALLQIETGRGVGASAPGNALSDYSLTGRLGFRNGPLCDDEKGFCSLYPYSTGTYSPFANRLTMQGPLGAVECRKFENELQCNVFGYDKKGSCKLSKKPNSATKAAQSPAGIFLDLPTDQMKPLPVPLPPDNAELVSALDGEFYGLLHHENRDIYQLLEMSIVASTSTENPHVENEVIVNPTMKLLLGYSWDNSRGLTLVYPQRIFGLNQGFAFKSTVDDLFAVISDWRSGYVSGVMYSKAYGRMGTFEMQKGTRPAIAPDMPLVLNPMGDFRGPRDAPSTLKNKFNVGIDIPNQSSGPTRGVVPLLGRYSGPGTMTMFDGSSFDLNTGALSFLITKPAGDRLVTGRMTAGRELKLLWPVAPALGAPMGLYNNYTYLPAEKR
jgi:hypothetical protein